LVAVNTEIAVLSATGVQLTEDGPPQDPARPTYYMQTTTTHAVATDLEGDGVLDIVAGSATPFPQATHGVVHVWVPGAPVGPLPWPAFHQDPALRRGVAPGTLTCAPPAPQGFFTLTPCRVADTRNPNGPLGGPAMTPMQQRNFPLPGTCGIPVTASSVALNITVTGSTGSGDLRLFPAGGAAPGTSTLNWSAGQTRANNSIVALGSSGGVTVWCVMFAGSTHVILDVVGYFE
jgi:hypothetical protein